MFRSTLTICSLAATWSEIVIAVALGGSGTNDYIHWGVGG